VGVTLALRPRAGERDLAIHDERVALAHDRYKAAASWVVKLDREPLGRAAPPIVSPRMRDPEGMQGR
jgi:hypothetical protein